MGFVRGAAVGMLVAGALTAVQVLIRVVADVPTLAEVISDSAGGVIPSQVALSASKLLGPALRPASYALLFLLIMLVAGGAGGLIGRWYVSRGAEDAFSPARRAQLERAAWGVLAVAGGAALWRYLASPRAGEAMGTGAIPSQRAADGAAAEVTPSRGFYKVSKNTADPLVTVADWRLQVIGEVKRPISLRYGDLQALASGSQWQTLECIGNPVGGDYIGNAQWGGVPLAILIERAGGVTNKAKSVLFHGADGYVDALTLDETRADGILVALTMNGEPLPPAHGYPARLLVPGTYGLKNVKWLSVIEPVEQVGQGYWQQRGWTQAARVKTMSRIDVPGRGEIRRTAATRIAGIAFAGDRGIIRVEVSDDGGAKWSAAQLRPPKGPYTWVQWELPWQPPAGWHRLAVRATDGSGAVQTAEKASSQPDGATGYHQVDVRVV